MSIFFDFKTINELIDDNYYEQRKKFNLEDLSQYNKSNEVVDAFTNVSKAWFLRKDDNISDMDNMDFHSTMMPTKSQLKQNTSKFTPDDWIRYINPLVTYALGDTTQGMNKERSYQKFILLGVLVGLGKTPQEAISQVQEWQNTGASQLLKSGTSTGGTATSGGMGTGGTSTGGAATSGSMGTGGTSTGGVATSGGMGTGGAATSGGMGTGGISTDRSGGIGIEERTVLPPLLTSFRFVNGGMGTE